MFQIQNNNQLYFLYYIQMSKKRKCNRLSFQKLHYSKKKNIIKKIPNFIYYRQSQTHFNLKHNFRKQIYTNQIISLLITINSQILEKIPFEKLYFKISKRKKIKKYKDQKLYLNINLIKYI
ncbi:hypothetical protein TTHERM_000798139 (macronuclear) [Tetrahymena thermophila SB210]|uniref:Uncharacterized protein n=1 Tax=Tetrahymena thermophila (strain SB210) TaxID=312017 RepID=W7XAD7_TETTS|nr:hypothetical protein TTHERM_000798139 [Tetrahymena thermophila SB210]EWS73353.1 hypothetical protein TTHERM_000798139 [Tetrahymena thermophila SB210]|eukprot:XP_012654125.1 hypothetical protein TTHERM_000798139 [Tetrahymena thermophila SB210]